MTVTINAQASTGIAITSDGSGVIKLQSAGVTTNALAWLNFVCSSGSINSSYNVSSVTRHTTGTYTVNFTNAMPNSQYAALTCGELSNGVTTVTIANPNISGSNGVKSTTQLGILSVNQFFALADINSMNVIVFGT